MLERSVWELESARTNPGERRVGTGKVRHKVDPKHPFVRVFIIIIITADDDAQSEAKLYYTRAAAPNENRATRRDARLEEQIPVVVPRRWWGRVYSVTASRRGRRREINTSSNVLELCYCEESDDDASRTCFNRGPS